MNLFESKIVGLITEELSKKDIEGIVKSQIKTTINSKDTEKVIKKIVADVLDEFFKLLYQRNNFWKTSIQR